MPENNGEDGARAKEVVAWVNAGAAVGVAVLVGVGGYLIFSGDSAPRSGATRTIESPEDAAPRSAAAAGPDAPAPAVSPPAESPTARTAESPSNRLPADRRRIPAGPRGSGPDRGPANDVRAPRASSPAVARAAEDSLSLVRTDRRSIQTGLRASGQDAGPADGVFGAGTRAAIQDWQTSRGVPATGYLNAVEAEELIALGRGRGEGRQVDAPRPSGRRPAMAAEGSLTVRAEPARRIELDGGDPTAATLREARDSRGDSILYRPVWRGNADAVRALISAGADVNARNSDGNPVLHAAVWRGRAEIVQMLVDAGADPNAREADDSPI